MPKWKGSYVGQVIANTRTYDNEGQRSVRYWVWDGNAWKVYNRVP